MADNKPIPTDPLEGYSKPSDEERGGYYTGLAGRPLLIARTSKDTESSPWHGGTDPWWGPDLMVLATVGNHDITSKWCPALREALVTCLNNADDGHSKLDWDAFYPIRTGRDRYRPTNPVVLMVSVRAVTDRPRAEYFGDITRPTWRAAMTAALKCRDILRLYGIHNVEVEFQTSSITLQSSPAAQSFLAHADFSFSKPIEPLRRIDPDCAELNSTIMPLLPFVGSRIEQAPSGSDKDAECMAGSVGVYVRLGPDGPDSPIYALTSRHVAIGDRCNPNDTVSSPGSGGNVCLNILSAGPTCIRERAAKVAKDIRGIRYEFRDTELDFFRAPESPGREAKYLLQQRAIRYGEEWCDRLLVAAANDDNNKKERRMAGSVSFSPRYMTSSPGFFADWALIKLANRKSTSTSTSTSTDAGENKIYLAGLNLRHIGRTMGILESRNPKLKANLSLEEHLDEQGFFRVHGDNLPSRPYFDCSEHESGESHLVLKRSAKSGLTFGITNEIEAVRRLLVPGKPPFVSYHLLVLGAAGGYFSRPGDSGSFVFDTYGQAVGQIDAGTGVNELDKCFSKFGSNSSEDKPPKTFQERDIRYNDVTFVTPVQWIFKSIEELTGRKPRIF